MTTPTQLEFDFAVPMDDDDKDWCVICGEPLSPPTITIRGTIVHKECAIMDGLIDAEDDEGN